MTIKCKCGKTKEVTFLASNIKILCECGKEMKLYQNRGFPVNFKAENDKRKLK